MIFKNYNTIDGIYYSSTQFYYNNLVNFKSDIEVNNG